jgi:hypothetical protein
MDGSGNNTSKTSYRTMTSTKTQSTCPTLHLNLTLGSKLCGNQLYIYTYRYRLLICTDYPKFISLHFKVGPSIISYNFQNRSLIREHRSYGLITMFHLCRYDTIHNSKILFVSWLVIIDNQLEWEDVSLFSQFIIHWLSHWLSSPWPIRTCP